MLVKKICFVAMFSAILCVLAPLSIPIGPVSITLATLGVYLISALLDFKLAPLVVIIYIVLGIIGLPVFSNFSSGVGIILGPTGGYIIGYILGSLIEALLITFNSNKKWMYPVAMVLATVAIYAFGSVWFYIQLHEKYTVTQVLLTCVTPFLLFDTIKIIIASLISINSRKTIDKYLKVNSSK